MDMDALPAETRDKNHKTLSDRIRGATLAGEFFVHFGAIGCTRDLLKLVREHGGDLVDTYAVATSTYCAATGNAWAHWRLNHLKFWWLWRSVRCFWLASLYAGEMKNEAGGEVGGLKVGQLLIFASVSRFWPFAGGEVSRSVAIRLANPNVKYDERVLLLLHQAAELEREHRAGGEFNEIKDIIARGGVTPLTRVRYLRAYALWLRRCKVPELVVQAHFDEAVDLATRANLGDQLVKIQAERRQ